MKKNLIKLLVFIITILCYWKWFPWYLGDGSYIRNYFKFLSLGQGPSIKQPLITFIIIVALILIIYKLTSLIINSFFEKKMSVFYLWLAAFIVVNLIGYFIIMPLFAPFSLSPMLLPPPLPILG